MKFITAFFCVLSALGIEAQTIVNAYARVTGIANSSVLTVANVDQANHTFTVGGNVIIMQMQDDVIGGNTTNAATFGNLSAIANAGRYEVRIIIARSPAAGTPTSITVSPALGNTYNTGTNSSVQLITFRDLGANYTTTANITGLAWDGNVGGVVSFSVTNTLTLRHRILADEIGFRGGLRSNTAGGGCDNTTYRSNSALDGFKGEGIYRRTDANYTNGRGKILNGGGGGNEHNGGGAGGGNYAEGGAGGVGYGCAVATPAGGLGGISLSAHISASRIFMGGGGGGGGQNNGAASGGMNGGGIILIKASAIQTGTVCGSSIQISANGGAAANIGNDGAGGGGAGGSIVLNVNSYSIAAACPMTVRANGGDGGDSGDGTTHAGGGGGGQGVVIYSSSQPTTNVTTQATNGIGGLNNSGGSSSAGTPTVPANTGVIPPAIGPLPVELGTFYAESEKAVVRLYWNTYSEHNNKQFIVDRSTDAINFVSIGTIGGAGNSSSIKTYSLSDHQPQEGLSYYRIKQVDFDGSEKIYPMISVYYKNAIDFSFYPNPVDLNEFISVSMSQIHTDKNLNLSILDLTGKVVYATEVFPGQEEEFKINLSQLSIEKGIYFIKLNASNAQEIRKLIIK